MAEDMSPHTNDPELVLRYPGLCRQRICDLASPTSGPMLVLGTASSYSGQAAALGITGRHPPVGQHTDSRTSRALQPAKDLRIGSTDQWTGPSPGTTPSPARHKPCHQQANISSLTPKTQFCPPRDNTTSEMCWISQPASLGFSSTHQWPGTKFGIPWTLQPAMSRTCFAHQLILDLGTKTKQPLTTKPDSMHKWVSIGPGTSWRTKAICRGTQPHLSVSRLHTRQSLATNMTRSQPHLQDHP